MTDEVVQRASTVLSGQNINAETQIACTSDRITYTLTTFDKEGRPAQMVPNYGRLSMMLRMDESPPIRLFHRPKLSNQFEFVDDQGQAPAASLLTLRLYTVNGEETIRLDQSASALRPMLDQCARSIGDRRQREQAARDQRAAEQYARCGDHPCPIEVPPLEPSTPLGEDRSTTAAPRAGATEVNLDHVAECKDQAEGRGTAGAGLDCPSILARFDQIEEEVARRDVEIEAEYNRREKQSKR